MGYYSGPQAVRDTVDEDDKQTLSTLVASYGEDFVPDLDRNELRDVFVSLCGVAYLVHESRWQDANLVKRWICRDVVPRLRNAATDASLWYRNAPTVPYPQNRGDDDDDEESDESDDDGNDEGPARDPLLDNIQVDAEKSVEFGIRDQIVEHIRDFYPDAEVILGYAASQLGGPRETQYLNGWRAGAVVLRKLPNGFADAFAIYLGHKYESVVLALHDHYMDLGTPSPRVCKMMMGAISQPTNGRIDDDGCDFSTNRNPKYWVRKFNKTALLKECDKRGVIVDNPMLTPNAKIIEALITADTV